MRIEDSNKPCVSCGEIHEGNETIVFQYGKIALCSYDKLMLKHLLINNDEDENVKFYK